MTIYVISGGESLDGTTVTGSDTVSSIVLSAGDVVSVTSGGNIQNVTLTNETLNVANNGSGSNLVVSNGGVAILGGGAFVSGITVFSGGLLSASGGNLTGAVVNSGGILQQPSGTLTNPVSVAVGAEVIFSGNGSNVSYTSGFSGGNEQIVVTSNAGTRATETITLLGSGYTFTPTTSGVKPALIVAAAPCYAGGTGILTERGEVAVESIQPNDTVVVRRDGREVLEPVTWVGSSTIDLTVHPRPELAAPIRVKAGALADNIPTHDLTVSPEHCMIIGGYCVPAKLLVNGGSIVREYPNEPFTYYHLELETHGILIAQGAAAESYLETGNRSSFDQAGLPRKLHPTFAINATSDRWSTDACAPLATQQDEIVPIWQTLADRSAALGFVAFNPAMTGDADLHITVDGRRIPPSSIRDARYVFGIPAGAKSVSLMSRSFIPADKMIAADRDTRRLGVRVDWLAIRWGGHETVLSADNPALQSGWYDMERSNNVMWRWTDGAAMIPWGDVVGAAVLTIRCTQADGYPAAQEAIRRVA